MKPIDCLIIGHNDMNFSQYESIIKRMGLDSGAYRDLNLNFIKTNEGLYPAAKMFNLCCRDSNHPGGTVKPLNSRDSLSATIPYLGTYLNKHGIRFDYVDSFQEEKEELAKKLQQENILTIAITTTLYVSVFPIIEIIDFIKKHNCTARIIVGGPFVYNHVRNQSPGELKFLFENIIGADYYVNSSQGEATLVKIIRSVKQDLPPHQINNIYYKTENGYAATPILEENNNLSENMVNWDLFSGRQPRFVTIRTSRSCPFSCAFCSYPKYAGKFQTADIDAIENELNSLKKIKTVEHVWFIDDTFNVPPVRFKKILRMILKNNYPFQWHCYFRCQFADKEIVALMKEAGCIAVYLGLESGNNQILKNMNKAVTLEQYYRGIQLIKEYGIITHGSFIIGFPGETDETVRDTIRFIEKSEIDFYRAQLWYYQPMTPIGQEKEKYKLEGKSFDWSSGTMNFKKACDWVNEVFLTIKKSISVPTYNFDFHNLLKLLYQGLSRQQIENFLTGFNNGIKEKLLVPSREEISPEALEQIKNPWC